MSNLKNLFKDTALYGIGKSIQKLIGLFLLPFYATVLKPEDFGIIDTLGVTTFFFIALCNLGLDSASGRFFFIAKTKQEKGELLFTILMLRSITIIPCLILACFSSQLSNVLFETTSYKWMVAISILAIPLNILHSDQERIFRYYFEPHKYNLNVLLKVFISAILGISLVIYLNFGALGALLSSFVSSFIFILIAFFGFNKKRYIFQFSFDWAKKMIKYGWPLIGATAAIWFYSSADRYIVLHYYSLTEVGIFSIGSKLIQIMGMLNLAVQMSFGPHMVNNYENDESLNKAKTKAFLSLPKIQY